MEKVLKLLNKNTLGRRDFKYEFVDEDGNLYLWNTSKEYWFEKKDWWTIKFEKVGYIGEYLEIKNCRVI